VGFRSSVLQGPGDRSLSQNHIKRPKGHAGQILNGAVKILAVEQDQARP